MIQRIDCGGRFLGATRPSVFAVPAALLRFAQGQAPAGLNNRVVGFQTLSPAKRKQEVTDPKLCLPPPKTPGNLSIA